MKKSILISCLFVVMTFTSCAQKSDNSIKTPEETIISAELIVNDLQIPWGMVFLPDGSMLITEKSGKLIHYKDGEKINISNVPAVYNRGQGGLLDIELHPNYEENGWIYLSYSSEEGTDKGGHTAISRAKLEGNALTNLEVLYKAGPNTTKGQHFGSRIEFDNNGYLYFTIGERGERDVNPQDITRDGGKVYRINDDGSIPQDNPFVNEPGAKSAIYTLRKSKSPGDAKTSGDGCYLDP